MERRRGILRLVPISRVGSGSFPCWPVDDGPTRRASRGDSWPSWVCSFMRGRAVPSGRFPAVVISRIDPFRGNIPCRPRAVWPFVADVGSYLVDPASSHMLVSKIKPCMSKYKQLYGETANGSLNQL